MLRSALLSVLLACAACATVTQQSPVYTPAFSFTPLKQGNGAGISIALVAPQYGGQLQVTAGDSTNPADMRVALGRALIQYLTANGMTVSGPFAKVDDMTFPEKKQTDLILTTTIDLMVGYPSFASEFNSWGDTYTNTLTGNCQVSAKVSFVMWEPLSMQRMWAKEADTTPVSGDCSISTIDETPGPVSQELSNRVERLEEQAFQQVMRTAERYFHPDEVQLVKKQSQELRQKKVF